MKVPYFTPVRVVFFVVISLVSFMVWCHPAREYPAESTIEAIYTQFDTNYPGRGLSDYESDQAVDIPKSYAMLLIAELIRQEKGILPDQPSLHGTAGYWLLSHASQNSDGYFGWSLPVAWDAFGDGSVNPAYTTYTINNAIVMHALLDWLEKSPSDAPRAIIYQELDAMIQPYLERSMRTPAGLLPYSLLACDRPYDVFNPAAYFAGQLQRYATMVGKRYSQQLREVADQTMQVLLNYAKRGKKDQWYWYYSAQEIRPNDLPHASYIALGIRDYQRYGGRLRRQFDWSSIRNHFVTFDRGESTLFGWPDFVSDVDRPARLYDVGIALHWICHESDMGLLREKLLQSVPRYRNAEGNYQKYPVDAGLEANMGDRVVNEYVSYLYLGLLSCRAKAN